jgi:hypothetical protein
MASTLDTAVGTLSSFYSDLVSTKWNLFWVSTALSDPLTEHVVPGLGISQLTTQPFR